MSCPALAITMTRYCYDGDQVIAEYDGNGALVRKYVYGPGIDEPICMIDVADNNAIYYYHFDRLGSVVALSNYILLWIRHSFLTKGFKSGRGLGIR